MRARLWIFVLLTAVVAWVAGARVVSSRAHARRAADAEAEQPWVPATAGIAPSPATEGGEGGPEAGARATVAVIDITPADVAPADPVPVDVVLVDGENGDVLRCTTTSVERGAEASLEFRVVAPDGYVVDGPALRVVKAPISRRTVRARLVEPLRHEANIRVRVVDAEGRPVRGARVDFRGPDRTLGRAGGLAGAYAPSELVPLGWSAPSDMDGCLRVRGIPHLLDERYWIVVRKDGAEVDVEGVLGAFGEGQTVEAVLPAASSAPATAIGWGLGGGAGGEARGRRGGRRAPVSAAALEVIVRLKDGRLGAGLEVSVGSLRRVADGAGRALFEDVPPGTWAVAVQDPDFIWSEAQVELREGERQTFILSERPGWTARLLVVDSTGRPVPFAPVEASSRAPVPYLCVEDGVQDLVLLTNADGSIRIPDLHHAPVALTVRYGSRSASVTVEEDDPSATVRLPPP